MTIADGELETAAEMSAAVDAGAVSPSELVERSVRRAESWQATTNAFCSLWGDEAMDVAGSIAPGGAGPSGLPIAVKDLYDVAGRETTGCCRLYAGRIAERDAPTIGRVRAAGLVMIGKTNQHELALGGTNLYSSCGRTGNPWDPRRMTGGSSGGSAAAVAAGVVPWALGSDTGGSIRIPASFCGTFGLKPTTGRIPIDGLLPLAPTMDTPGPIAATAGDLAALYRILAGTPALAGARSRPYRLALVGGYFRDQVHPDVVRAVQQVAATFEAVGVMTEEVGGDGIDDARATWRLVCYPEFVDAHPALAGRWDAALDPAIRSAVQEGAVRSPRERADAAARRAEIERWFARRLEDADALLVPTTGYPAPLVDQGEFDLGEAGRIDLDRIGPGWFTCPVNLANLPAVNLPAGSSEGMPVGVSLVGRPGDEEGLLTLAVSWEEASGYRARRG